MIFKRSMCILCGTKPADNKFEIKLKNIGVCRDCFKALPETGRTKTFAALKTADYIISPFYYKNALRDAILDYKFNDCYAYAGVFSRLIEKAVSDMPHLKEFDMIIPVPLSKRRMTERGYNQAALIAKSLSEFLDIEYNDTVLFRGRNTKRQSGLKSYERIINVKDAFSASSEVYQKSIIVFDDIYTTGATMEECAKALKSAGAKRVIGMTAAIAYKNPINTEARLNF